MSMGVKYSNEWPPLIQPLRQSPGRLASEEGTRLSQQGDPGLARTAWATIWEGQLPCLEKEPLHRLVFSSCAEGELLLLAGQSSVSPPHASSERR